jgi:AraC-like DNA-binding protein
MLLAASSCALYQLLIVVCLQPELLEADDCGKRCLQAWAALRTGARLPESGSHAHHFVECRLSSAPANLSATDSRLQVSRMLEQTASNLSVVAAQLVEAACCARDGDSDAAQAYIAHAVALLKGQHGSASALSRLHERASRRLARGGLPAWQVRRLTAYVDANLGEGISVARLARFVNLSASYFCHAFKRTFGVSPHAWLIRRRVEMAQALMLTTSATLSEIAMNCGMVDQAHFTRCFRRVTGETPYAWRRARRCVMEGRGAEPVVAPPGTVVVSA